MAEVQKEVVIYLNKDGSINESINGGSREGVDVTFGVRSDLITKDKEIGGPKPEPAPSISMFISNGVGSLTEEEFNSVKNYLLSGEQFYNLYSEIKGYQINDYRFYDFSGQKFPIRIILEGLTKEEKIELAINKANELAKEAEQRIGGAKAL